MVETEQIYSSTASQLIIITFFHQKKVLGIDLDLYNLIEFFKCLLRIVLIFDTILDLVCKLSGSLKQTHL